MVLSGVQKCVACRSNFSRFQAAQKESKFTVKHFSHTCWFPFLRYSAFPFSDAGGSNFLRVYRRYECKTTMGVPFGSTQQKFIFKFRSWFTIKRRKKENEGNCVCKWKWNFLRLESNSMRNFYCRDWEKRKDGILFLNIPLFLLFFPPEHLCCGSEGQGCDVSRW